MEEPNGDSSSTVPTQRREETINDTLSPLDEGHAEEPSVNMDQIDLDPSTLCASVASLLSAIETTSTRLSELHADDDAHPELQRLSSQCHKLYKVYTDIEEVLTIYTKVWTPDDLDVDPPLDPGMIDCILSVSSTLHEVEDAIERVNKEVEVEACTAIFKTANMFLTNHVNLVQEFLPIMKADLGDFLEIKPHDMTKVVAHYNDAFYTAMHQEGSPGELRHDLYMLKDQLAALMSTVRDTSSQEVNGFDSLKLTLIDLIEELKAVWNVITEMLTNHGSEWIESMLGGRIAYNQFRKIDAVQVRHKTLTFKRLQQKFSCLWRDVELFAPLLAGDCSRDLTEDEKEISKSWMEGTEETNLEMRSELAELREIFKISNYI